MALHETSELYEIAFVLLLFCFLNVIIIALGILYHRRNCYWWAAKRWSHQHAQKIITLILSFSYVLQQVLPFINAKSREFIAIFFEIQVLLVFDLIISITISMVFWDLFLQSTAASEYAFSDHTNHRHNHVALPCVPSCTIGKIVNGIIPVTITDIDLTMEEIGNCAIDSEENDYDSWCIQVLIAHSKKSSICMMDDEYKSTDSNHN